MIRTAAVAMQRLGKHVPISRQQILNNATVERCVLDVVRAEML
jgi:hypothetical protein